MEDRRFIVSYAPSAANAVHTKEALNRTTSGFFQSSLFAAAYLRISDHRERGREVDSGTPSLDWRKLEQVRHVSTVRRGAFPCRGDANFLRKSGNATREHYARRQPLQIPFER